VSVSHSLNEGNLCVWWRAELKRRASPSASYAMPSTLYTIRLRVKRRETPQGEK